MSVVIESLRVESLGSDKIKLQQEGFDAILRDFKKSLRTLNRDKNRIETLNTEAEEGCLYEFNQELSGANRTIEKNYQYISDAIKSTYDILTDYGVRVRNIDAEAGVAVSGQRVWNGENRNGENHK